MTQSDLARDLSPEYPPGLAEFRPPGGTDNETDQGHREADPGSNAGSRRRAETAASAAGVDGQRGEPYKRTAIFGVAAGATPSA